MVHKIIAKVPESTMAYQCGERLMACTMTEHWKLVECNEFFKTYEEAKAYTNQHPEYKWNNPGGKDESMRDYTVYFIIKKNNHGYLNQQTIKAKNQREAIKAVKEKVLADTGKHAFSCTTQKPERASDGMRFNGMTYTRYSDLFNTLW